MHLGGHFLPCFGRHFGGIVMVIFAVVFFCVIFAHFRHMILKF